MLNCSFLASTDVTDLELTADEKSQLLNLREALQLRIVHTIKLRWYLVVPSGIEDYFVAAREAFASHLYVVRFSWFEVDPTEYTFAGSRKILTKSILRPCKLKPNCRKSIFFLILRCCVCKVLWIYRLAQATFA